jgi:hypothetical protein
VSGIKRVMNVGYLAKISAAGMAGCFFLCFDRFKSADAYSRIEAILAGKGTS